MMTGRKQLNAYERHDLGKFLPVGQAQEEGKWLLYLSMILNIYMLLLELLARYYLGY